MRLPPRPTAARPAVELEQLEAREVPAVTVLLDYSRDLSGFFANNPAAQAVLQQAVNTVAGQLDTSLAAIVPGGGNTWTETFIDPSTGQQASIANPALAANTIVVYVGGRSIGGSETGVGGYGGYSAVGSQAWLNTIQSRGPAGSLLWGGSIAFDTTTNWFFGSTSSGLTANQVDFLSVAEHEFGHLLGLGTAPSWFSQVSGGTFRGANADAVYGGPVPLYGDAAHWANGLAVGGVRGVMDPILPQGVRAPFSPLDYAALKDIGWSMGAVPPPVVPPPPPFTPPQLNGAQPVVLTGPTDGSAQVFVEGPNQTLTAVGGAMSPFPGFTGVIRSTVADFNGDGSPDYAFATGAGVAAQVRIIDGKTGQNLVPTTQVLGGFTGGAFLAAGDVNRDGKAELAVSGDVGGGPRVQVFKVQNGGLVALADFIAFDSPDFRGGSRVALGDVNRDGAADLIVGAGVGGGPRVSIYSGASLAGGQLGKLVPDFFALDPAMRSGVYVTAGDFNGDGYTDVAYSTGDTGGPRVRVVSGQVLYSNPGADVAKLPAMADFFALDPNDRSGIRLAARDLDHSGRATLIVGSGNKTNAAVRLITLAQMNVPTSPLANPLASPFTIDGVYVG